MKFKMLFLLGLLGVFCHKDIMRQQGFTEIKNFEWKVLEAENRLNIKYWLLESPVDTIKTITVKIRVDGIDLENTFHNPTIKIDNEKGSLHPGIKCIEESWTPILTVTKTNVESVRFYMR